MKGHNFRHRMMEQQRNKNFQLSMFIEILMMDGIAVSAIGVSLGWYAHHQNRLDKKKKEEEQKADE
jgi:hypothetical protein